MGGQVSYRVQYQPSSSVIYFGNVRNFKLEFPYDSTVTTTLPSFCTAMVASGFSTGYGLITCTVSTGNPTSSNPASICVNNLNGGQSSYDFNIINGFINAKVAKKVVGIRCIVYDSTGGNCDSGFIEEKNTVKIQYTPNDISNKVKITLSDATNGLTNTATF